MMPISHATLSVEQLRQSYESGREVQRLLAEFANEGRTMFDIVMNGKPFAEWEMYPWEGGILDQRTGSQYFYHCHPGLLYDSEHGHFHTFYYHQRKLVHLVAIGLNRQGQINKLYTFNRWGPGDTYFLADEVKTFLPRFRIQHNRELDTRLHATISGLLVLFRAEIEWLLDQRDATFAHYRKIHRGQSPFEDRSLEITSDLKVDVKAQVERLRKALENGRSESRVPKPATSGAEGVTAPANNGEIRLPRLEERPLAELRRSLEGGLALRAVEIRLREQGRSLVEAIMNGKPFEVWTMYPWDHGVIDKRTRSQYFYHAHPQTPEHGHFHLFYHHKNQLAHLVAVALDNAGEPISLFTVNRWVTDEVVLPASKMKSYVPRFRVDNDAFDREVSDYLRHLLALYHAEIGALLDQRDAVYAAYRARHNGRQPYEDRDLEMTGALEIQVDEQIAGIEHELRRRGPLA